MDEKNGRCRIGQNHRGKRRRIDTWRLLHQEQIEFRELAARVVAPLGFLSSRNELAKEARMLAVKSFDQGHFQRLGPGVSGGHRHPRDGLKRRPMPAQYNRQRRDRHPPDQPGSHNGGEYDPKMRPVNPILGTASWGAQQLDNGCGHRGNARLDCRFRKRREAARMQGG